VPVNSDVRAHVAHTFTLSRSDFSSFQKEVGKLVRKRLPRGRSFLLQVFVWLFVGLAVSTYFRLYENAFEYRRAVALTGGFIVAAAAAFVFGQAVSARVVQRHLLLENGSLLAPQTLTLDENGLALSTLNGLSSSHYAWAAFIGRTEDARNLYLFLDASYALIIPKNVVAGAGEEVIRRQVGEL
jgi:hypothetical protein